MNEDNRAWTVNIISAYLPFKEYLSIQEITPRTSTGKITNIKWHLRLKKSIIGNDLEALYKEIMRLPESHQEHALMALKLFEKC